MCVVLVAWMKHLIDPREWNVRLKLHVNEYGMAEAFYMNSMVSCSIVG